MDEIFTLPSTLEVITEAIDAVVLGRAAVRILAAQQAARDAAPPAGGLWLAPTWAWYRSADLFEHATTKRLQPRRLSWSGGPIVLVDPHGTREGEPASAHVTWTEPGAAMRTGTTVVTLDITPRPRRRGAGAPRLGTGRGRAALHLGVPSDVHVAALSPGQMTTVLAGLAERGHQVGWRFLMWLERFVERELPRANVAVGMEIREHLGAQAAATALRPGAGAVDDTTLETLRHRLMFGEPDRPGRIHSLVERAYADSTFAAVDPVSWLRRGISRDCNQVVRSAVGDPRQGRRIRAAHALGLSPSMISQQIGVSAATVEKALNPGGDAVSRAVSLPVVHHADGGGSEHGGAEYGEPTPDEVVDAAESVHEMIGRLQHPAGARRTRSAEGSKLPPGVADHRLAVHRLRQVLAAGSAAPALYLRSLGITPPPPW